MTDQGELSHNARWLRDMRADLGWSTTDTAEYAREAAAELDDEIRISQQLVSAFENGKHKATPRWLGYVQIAMSHYIARRNLDVPRLWELRLPAAMTNFFAIRRADANRRDEWEDLGVGFAGEGDGHTARPGEASRRAETVKVAMIDLAYGMGGTFIEGSPRVRMAEFPLAFIRHFTHLPIDELVIAESVGDSMTPTIGPNDLVLINRRAVDLNINDKIWCCAVGNIGMIKRLRVNGDTITILSDNANVPDDHAVDGELHIIGQVVGKFSRL